MRDRREILNDHLLGELPEDERAQLRPEIEADPLLAAELAELSPLVATLEDLPAEAWDQVEAPPLNLHRDPPESERRNRFKEFFTGSFALRPALAFAAVLAIFAAGLGVGLISGGDNSTTSFGPVATQASLSPVGEFGPAATGQATVKQGGQVIRLKISGLEVNSDNNFYEAWLMDPKDGFISLGTFRIGSDGSTTLDLPVAVATDRFPVVDISLQPTNGKPTHSGVSVLRGTLN